MFSEEEPEDFDPEMEVVSCFIEHDGEMLLLQRQDHKPQGGTWGMPAGKIDDGENKREALSREVKEETGLEFSPESFDHFETVYVRYPSYDFVYHMFYVSIDERQNVRVNPEEYKGFGWFEPQEAMNLRSIRGLDKCVEMFYDL